MSEPLLAGALGVLLPSPTETLFLRACLLGDCKAWQLWSERIGDPKQELGTDTRGIKRLSPLLYESLRESGAPLGEEFLSYLRAATVREELRVRTFRRVGRAALQSLTQAGVPFIVLKGVALMESVYPVWALRHCHDVDLLIHESDKARVVSALKDFSHFASDKKNITLVHATNLPIALHTSLFEEYETPVDVWQKAVEASVLETRIQVLAPHHALQHLCVHAASIPSRRSLLWVADATRLISTQHIDWQNLVSSSHQSALPTFVMLRYLRDALDADIPDETLTALSGNANTYRAAALRGAAATVRHRDLLRVARGWRERLFIAAWIASQTPLRMAKKLAQPRD